MGLHVYVAIAQISWPAASGAISAQKYALAASVPTTCLPVRMQKGQGNFCPSMVLESRLPLPKFRLGADCDAACAKRDERQFSKAAQARNCPMPDAFLVGYTEERAKCSKKKISKEQQKETEA